jgi:cytochrome c-type biogenesis protein
MKRQMAWITRASGVLMIAVGILMITNYFTILASVLQQYTPEWIRSRL